MRKGGVGDKSQPTKSSKSTFNPTQEATQALAIGVRARPSQGVHSRKTNSKMQRSSSDDDSSNGTNRADNMGGLLDTSSCGSDDEKQGQWRQYQPVNNFVRSTGRALEY